ncbi:MAG: PA4780 family RIO1-like protein kinase [Polyangiales bacterium]
MRIPESLSALVDHGIIERVVRPLMSGKEAHIYLIESGGEQRVAKIYKDSQDRTFQNRADYTEGRKVRNSRDQRAMGSRSKHGRAQNEAAWKTAEVNMIYRLREAGVRVPVPYNFIDGVLIMELVCDAEGYPAPRLGDIEFEPEQATKIFHALLGEVVRMLCAGVVHGDLSDFNVLVDENGPVVIDFPQAVDAASNANARKLLLRDVDNLHRFHAKFAPEAPALPYAQEMWDLYQRNALAPDTRLTGKFRGSSKVVSTDAVLGLIADADHDERRRREKLGIKPQPSAAAAAAAAAPREAPPQRNARAPHGQTPQARPDAPRQDQPREQRRDQPREPRRDQPRDQPREHRRDQPREQRREPLREQPRDQPREVRREPQREQPREVRREPQRAQEPRREPQRAQQGETARTSWGQAEKHVPSTRWGRVEDRRPVREVEPARAGRTVPLDGPLLQGDEPRPQGGGGRRRRRR